MGHSSLVLLNHGGECCGIKTVVGFGYGPGSIAEKMGAIAKAAKRDDRDMNGGHVTSDTPFFTDDAPVETRLDRLRRYIAFMKKRRPCNLLEAVLANSTNSGTYWDQYQHWKPVLEAEGFVETISHLNSNSDNICHVFYLKIDEDYPGKDVDSDEDQDEDDYPEDDDYDD